MAQAAFSLLKPSAIFIPPKSRPASRGSLPPVRQGSFMKPRNQVTAFVFSLLFSTTLMAADWPQWRGPDRSDVSSETGLLKSWPKSGPPLLWTNNKLGVGYSGPAVVGDKI